MKIKDMFLFQEETALETSITFYKALMKTGKAIVDVPPDCFIWTGTKEELELFLKENLINQPK